MYKRQDRRGPEKRYKDFMTEPGIIGVHPNENTATVWLKTVDLISIVMEHGNACDVIEL